MTVSRGLRLRLLRTDDEAAVRAGQLAMAADDFEFALGLTPGLAWDAYLEQLAREHAARGTPPRSCGKA